jgi:acetamidase/formamidase
MDAQEVREGTTVYLPIFHDGAYFDFGDGHARQGYGEVAGTGSRPAWTWCSGSTW